MNPRRAAHVLSRISGLLELSGVERFRARAYDGAADAIRDLTIDDITPLYRSGELANAPGVGPATLSVLGELVETGESAYLERLLRSVPEGLIQVASVPGLSATKAALLHRELGVENLEDLEAAAIDGRLRTVRGFGEKTVKRVLEGIEVVRGRRGRLLFREAAEEARRSADQIAIQADVSRVEVAGEIRRITDVVGSIVLVAECTGDPASVLRDITHENGVLEAERHDSSAHIRFVDDAEIDLSCVAHADFPMTLWRATGNADHVVDVAAHAEELGFRIESDGLRSADGKLRQIGSERELYATLRLEYIPPELREGLGEVAAAARSALPRLIKRDDLTGVLHCHSDWSDGSVPIAEMAVAARERGWKYLGISDHSQAAFYAGGLKPDAVLRQHEEIDRLNAQHTDFRILKGIECDILSDGQLDYDSALLDTFDYVIGSIHSRFSMGMEAMTERIVTAMDDPHLTIVAHPTGRLLLRREPYAVDLDAVIAKAIATGVTLELDCDPDRLDLDWRWCKIAVERGARIEIGPDAHSPRGLDHTWFGVALGRKAWLTASDVLNTRTADDIVAIAHARRG